MKNQSKNKNFDRKEAETKEGLATNYVTAPESRFQTDQQVAPAINADKTETPDSGFIKKELKAKGSALKQEVASEVITAKSAGAVDVASPAAYGLKSMPFSGDTGTLLGDTSGTPIMDKAAQGASRIDKRLSDANKDINFLASEQILVSYDNVAPLAASIDDVGYNGNPKNNNARAQKNTGLTPSELLFDRSIDFIANDNFVFTSGQVVMENADLDTAYPNKTYTTVEDEEGNITEETTDFYRQRGNYSPRYLVVKVKKDDKNQTFISGFEVVEDDFNTNYEDFKTVNKASTNHQIDLNRAELTRQTIDADAGSPTSDHFNPLGRSVNQPTRTVTLLQDVENSTGATIFTAYKFANKAKAHYLNRTSKDGQDLVAPAIDALYGHLLSVNDRDELIANYGANDESMFSKQGMRMGSAALMIALFDSKNKYKTKADIVTQPRGLKMHLQTADNNMDPFRCKTDFVAALNSIDAYSTIDRGYDPMSTVCITDNVRLVYPYSMAEALSFTRSKPGAREYTSNVYTYNYSAGSGQNSYTLKVADPVLNGIAYFLELHSAGLYEALADNPRDAGEVTLTIPTVHSTMHFSLWDLLICASTPYIIYERTNTMKDILDYEQFYKYPFIGNTPIKTANPLNAVNYISRGPLAPLVVGQMVPSSAIRWTWPEVFTPLDEEHCLLPYYYNEDSFRKSGEGKLTDNDSSNFSTPVIRSGVRLAYADDFWSMSAKENLLCYDVMVSNPFAEEGEAYNEFDGLIYKYSQGSEGLVVVNHGDLSEEVDYITTVHRTPRQLGWFMPAYFGECCNYGGIKELETSNLGKVTIDKSSKYGFIGATPGHLPMSSFRAIMYKGIWSNIEQVTTILGKGQVNIGRAQAFTQFWAMSRAYSPIDNATSSHFDLRLSISDLYTDSKAPNNVNVFSPFINKGYNHNNPTANVDQTISLYSPHRVLWPLLQKLPFVINPFDATNSSGVQCDPFGYAYMFNLAGFMSADYNEMQYNRQNMKQEQGFGYTKDPFVAASPVFKDAYRSTQIG